MKNFLSIGAVTQSVILNKNGLVLVLGENLDQGGNGSRNGVGKSSLLNAISYGLYGIALNNIKRDNLINAINKKNMVVSVEFEQNSHKYRIERGRKPNFVKFYVDDAHVNQEDTDEAQGESRETQAEINKILGMSHDLFKHIIALNTSTIPFLDMGSAKQRETIEELLGITLLSQKAANLKQLISDTKIAIDQEEIVIKTIKQSNDRIQNTVREFNSKAEQWQTKHINALTELEQAIESLSTLDIDQELQNHNDLSVWTELSRGADQLQKDIQLKTRHVNQLNTQLQSNLNSYSRASSQECPTCQQQVKGHQHEKIMSELEATIATLDQQVNREKTEIAELEQQLNQIVEAKAAMTKPVTVYTTLKEALNHKSTIDQLAKDYEREFNNTNPFLEQANSLSATIQEVSFDQLNKLVRDREHQEFLFKLLTNKDSFIRKRIIDQNLSYLNNRLSEYLAKLGLPHDVTFQNDLTVEITRLGQDFDFQQLSRGERTRLILALSWAFRDIFESTVHSVNLLFIDELLDQGIDTAGLESSVEILKKMERERKKNIFVISHREELVTRVGQVLTCIKEDGYTRFDWEYGMTN